MLIKISKKDLKKTFLYKSIFFKFINFTTDDEELKPIVQGLNIKNRHKRITYVYDKSCEIIDTTNCPNACSFKGNKCLVQQLLDNGKCNGCCRICHYQSSKGCTTKNLTCKLFNCSEVRKKYKLVTYDDLTILKLLSYRQRVILRHDYFSSREEVLYDLYSYSLIYSITCKVIRHIYYLIRYHKM